ncbi:MAG: DUF2971 domain-containing protein [Pyrinomonadaceae bacterium]
MDFKRKYLLSKSSLPTLFHYCTDTSFHQIILTRSLRFTSLETMNDSLELKWGPDLLNEIIREWELSKMHRSELKFTSELKEMIGLYKAASHSLASCFSLNGDLLSQWRAYTADASGFSIGFDLVDLNHNLRHTPLEVLYVVSKQRRELREWVKELSTVYHGTGTDRFQDFVRGCGRLSSDLLAYKNPAFDEEREIRLVTDLRTAETATSSKILVSGMGQPEVKIEFAMRSGVPSPYIDHNFDGERPPIREVVIGPKNRSTEQQIMVYLATLGIDGVKVRKSNASYR